MKLGKLAPRRDPRTLKLVRYLKRALAPAPLETRWQDALPAWRMFLNDQAGCCTIATCAHLIQCWTANQGGIAVPVSDDQVLAAYQAVTADEGAGYDPATGANDNGCQVLDVLNYWRHVGIAGEQLGAFAVVNAHDLDQLRQAVWLFGGAYLGVQLPAAAERQISAGLPWDVRGPLTGPATPGSWGGHAVPIVGYDRDWAWLVTWGQLQRASWAWLAAYLEEAYALFDADWVIDGTPAPNGFDAAALRADLAALTG